VVLVVFNYIIGLGFRIVNCWNCDKASRLCEKAMVGFEPEWIDSYRKGEFKSVKNDGSDNRTTPVTVKNGS
jgi:hypothetical protein